MSLQYRRVLIGDALIIEDGKFFDKEGACIQMSVSPMSVAVDLPTDLASHLGVCGLENGVLLHTIAGYTLMLFHRKITLHINKLNDTVIVVNNFVKAEDVWIDAVESWASHLLK